MGAPVALGAAVVAGRSHAQEAAEPAAGEAPAQAAPSAAPAEALPNCPAEDGEAMRASLKYVELSPHGAERDCRNCEFWIPEEAGAACGGCTLIPGPISPTAYCDVWAPTL